MKMFGDVTRGIKQQRRALARQLKQIDSVLVRLGKIESKKQKRAGTGAGGGRRKAKAKRVSKPQAQATKAKRVSKPQAQATKASRVKTATKVLNAAVDKDLEAKRRRLADLKRASTE